MGGLLLLVIALWLVPEMHHVFARFTNAASDILTGRRKLWDLSLQMFSEAPLFGKGLGAFNEFAARQGYLDTSGARWNYYGHNCYYEFLGELGMVGFVLVFGSIFYMLVKTFLLSRNEALSRKQRVHIYTALAIELMLLIYCISGNVLLYADQTLALFFSFAVVRSVMIQNINLEEKAENRRFYAE